MRNPGIFISTPALTSRRLAVFKRDLSALALSHGFAAHRGKKRGSIYALLESLASGELATVLLADEDRRTAIKELRRIAKDALTHPYIRDAFSAIAAQLEAAAKRDDSE